MESELDKKFSENIERFECVRLFSSFALGVSGGSDSIALLELSRIWAKLNNKKLIVIHVDHQLRPNSKLDGDFVRNYCQKLQVECHILLWNHDNNVNNIQHNARINRYRLIMELCDSLKIYHLFTGHHLDDNTENFIQRLIRGSGVIGLSNCREHFYDKLRILRPLYNFTKDECKQYLISRKIDWIEDETNLTTKYLRNDIRSNIAGILEKQNISYEDLVRRLAKTQSNFDDLLPIVKNKITEVLSNYCFIENLGYAVIDYNFLKCEFDYIQHLIISYLITIISGKDFPPRANKVTNILQSLKKGVVQNYTLHNTKIILLQDKFLITQEIEGGIRPTEPIALRDNLLWGNKFLFRISEELNFNLIVDSFNEEDYSKVDFKFSSEPLKKFDKKILRQIIFTLPILAVNNKMVAIPMINYYDKEMEYLSKILKVSFSPSFTSKLIHF